MNNRKHAITLCICGSLALAGCGKAPTAQPAAPAPETAQTQTDAQVINLDDTNFAAQTAQGVTLVSFWAPWCPPCAMQGPIIDDVAKQLGPTARVAKVNVDEAPATTEAFGIEGIPALFILKDGKPISQFTGLTPADELTAAVKGAL